MSGNNDPTMQVGVIPFKRDAKNFAPNFGFAWNPNFKKGWLRKLTGGDKTVIRGYWGQIYYDEGTQFFAANAGPNIGKTLSATTLIPGQPGATNLPAFYTLANIVANPLTVAPYQYLCGGQLTNCVPQPGSDRRLDAQGDKIMARLVYRKVNGHESVVAVHSINTSAGGGGVRWYEFRVDKNRDLKLYQQGTYAPDNFYRWMASPAIDRKGNIGIGYSFGGTPNFPGQRFAARLANDPLGQLTLRETVLVEGEAAQNVIRWEDYTQTAMDPSDDCTIWYVGDYLKKDTANYSSRIGAFRMPGCRGAR